MKIQARFFSICRDITGDETVEFILPDGATGEDFWRKVIERYPSLAPFRGQSRLAVNMEYADNLIKLSNGDEVCIIPPVSGG